MVEGGRGSRLALEAGAAIRIARDLGREELDGQGPPEPGVPGKVHDAHAAPAELALDGVGTDAVRMAWPGHDRRLIGRIGIVALAFHANTILPLAAARIISSIVRLPPGVEDRPSLAEARGQGLPAVLERPLDRAAGAAGFGPNQSVGSPLSSVPG